jgi:hypothetical protein
VPGEVDGSVDEAEQEVVRGDVYDEVDLHVVYVDGDLFCVWPVVWGTMVTEDAAHAGEARKPHSFGADEGRGLAMGTRRTKRWMGLDMPCEGTIKVSGLENLCEVALCRLLLIWVDKVDDRLSDEKRGLVLEVVGEHGVQVDKGESGGDEGPVCWRRLATDDRAGETID